jgi:catechol 2,3-dioxygenase-like lactoylglutathione lyase family enzyme
MLGANHTNFTVSDLDRSTTFFSEALGFKILSMAPRDATVIQNVTGVQGASIMVLMLKALTVTGWN